MKYLNGLILIFLVLGLIACGSEQAEVEFISEDGVEVVLNGLNPFHPSGEPTKLSFEELFAIDSEDQAVLDLGLSDIETFDVDEQGNIFIIPWRNSGDFVFKFDDQGNFVTSFAENGEGPGRLMFGGTVQVWSDTTLMARDPSLSKFQTFSPDGEFIREVSLPERFSIIQILSNGNFLIAWQEENVAEKKRVDFVGLCNVLYQPIKELDSYGWPAPEVADRVVKGKGSLVYAASRDFIYVGNPDRDYDIWVFDPDGALLRKIRKEYKPVKMSREYQDSVLNSYPEESSMRRKIVFRTHWVPFRYFIADDQGWLYVMTYEDAENPRAAIYDVFNARGVFVDRVNIANQGTSGPLPARIKGGRLYCLVEKESGNKKLVVSSIKWE